MPENGDENILISSLAQRSSEDRSTNESMALGESVSMYGAANILESEPDAEECEELMVKFRMIYLDASLSK